MKNFKNFVSFFLIVSILSMNAGVFVSPVFAFEINEKTEQMEKQAGKYYYWAQKPDGKLVRIKSKKSDGSYTEKNAKFYTDKKGYTFIIGQYNFYPEKSAVLQFQLNRSQAEGQNNQLKSYQKQNGKYYYWVKKDNGKFGKVKSKTKFYNEAKAKAYAKKKGYTFLVGQYGSYPEKPIMEKNESNIRRFDIVTVTNVVDGDTFHVLYSDNSTSTIRLLGVDTPETYKKNKPYEYGEIINLNCLKSWGEGATDYAERLLENKRVTLLYDSIAGERGIFDRLLAYIEVNRQDFGTLLLQNGYARVYTESDFEKKDYYISVLQEIEANKIGLWSCAEEAIDPCIAYCEKECLKKYSLYSYDYLLCFIGSLEICNIRNEIPF